MRKFVESLWLFLIGVILVSAIYAGLTITKEVKASDNFGQTQKVLTEKITDLEGKIEGQNKTIAVLQNELEGVKKLASAPKQILGATTESQSAPEPTPTPPPTPEPEQIIKTVTKTVVVKDEPDPEASVIIEGVGSFQVDIEKGDTAFDILKRASAAYKFALEYDSFDFGVFVTAIGGIKPAGNQYWAFYYNGKYSNVGASDQAISEDDTIYWKLESF